MKLAVVAAGFTPGEADQLRRAMGAWRKTGVIEKFQEKLLQGMREKGLSDEFADQVFRQIRGFGEYGFPESHAASFAVLVYISAWLKRYFPAAFCASVINSHPMGFYAPAQLVADARSHGVNVRPVDINHSNWDCTLEGNPGGRNREARAGSEQANGQPLSWPDLRLGFRLISGLRQDAGLAIERAREKGPFVSMVDFANRTGLGQATLSRLSQADAFGSLQQDRRASLWQALAQSPTPQDQPLFDTLDPEDSEPVHLPELSAEQQVADDYQSIGLSLRAHPISFYREQLNELKVTPTAELKSMENNRHLRVAGLVILRQRPSTANGITFVTMEDETGTANLVVKQQVWERYYQVARQSQAWIAHGKLEKKNGVIHLVVNRLEDLSSRLGELKFQSRDFR